MMDFKRFWVVLSCVFLFAGCYSSQVYSANAQSERIQKILSGMKKSGRYEFDFPNRKNEPPARRPAPSQPNSSEVPDKSTKPDLPTVAPFSISSTLLYVIWIVGALVLLYFLLPVLTKAVSRDASEPLPRRDESGGRVVQAESADAPDTSSAVGMAQLLASEGRFSEAVHFLWLEIIQDLEAERINNISPADTGRDIIRNLRSGNREMLAKEAEMLLRAVELTWFGGREVEASQYETYYSTYSELKKMISQGATPESAS